MDYYKLPKKNPPFLEEEGSVEMRKSEGGNTEIYERREKTLRYLDLDNCKTCERGIQFPNCDFIFKGGCTTINRQIDKEGKVSKIVIKGDFGET